jgi:hypothetical protein
MQKIRRESERGEKESEWIESIEEIGRMWIWHSNLKFELSLFIDSKEYYLFKKLRKVKKIVLLCKEYCKKK